MAPTTRKCRKKKKKLESGEDRISCLPDPVLDHILSFLSTDCAVRTCVLSTKWKYLWTGISNLDFSDTPLLTNLMKDNEHRKYSVEEMTPLLKKFINFVDKVILLRDDAVVINKFHLFCTLYGEIGVAFHIHEWISYALSHNVRDIFLSLHFRDLLVLPWAMFDCDSLTVICSYGHNDFKFSYKFDDSIQKLSQSICLSRLKVLHLTNIEISFDQPIPQVSFSFPILHKLELIYCLWKNVKIVSFFAPVLETFSFDMLDDCNKIFEGEDDIEIKLYAESLVSLEVGSDLSYRLSLYDLSALHRARLHIEGHKYTSEVKHRASNIFEAIRKVGHLTLFDTTITDFLYSENFPENLLALTNLTILNIDDLYRYLHGGLLENLFRYLPGVKSLLFSRGLGILDYADDDDGYHRYPENYGWTVETIPQPILSNLELVEITHFYGNENELGLVKFLLKNARALEKIVISSCQGLSVHPKKHLEISNKLQALSRGSTCSIGFS